MKVLFLHQNFPGQYKNIAPGMAADPENEVWAMGQEGQLRKLPGPIRYATYPKPLFSAPQTHPYVRNLENAVRRGQLTFKLLEAARDKHGFVPDVVCCHPGWGDGLYIRDIYPDAKLLYYFEFFYRSRGFDTNFDPEYPTSLDDCLRIRTKNATNLLTMEVCDWGICPTRWQASSFPDDFKHRLSVIHDGIDTDIVKPDPGASIRLGSGKTLTAKDEVITFVNRNLEPYRGFHSFMRALPEIQRRRPGAFTIIVGGDEVSYGRAPDDYKSHKEKYLSEVKGLDMSRLAFVGRVPYDIFINLLQISSVHVYLTYPFILSWSCLEALSAGCAVVGSSTPPVTEVIKDGETGLVVDFFDPGQIAEATVRVLANQNKYAAMRKRARQMVIENYDLKSCCLPKHLDLITKLGQGVFPPAPGMAPGQ